MATKHTVGQFMTRHTRTVGFDQPAALALRMMRKHGVHHLPVLDAGRIVGVVDERDLAVVESGRHLDLDQARTAQVMSPAYCVAPQAPLAEVVRAMALAHHSAAVVVEGDEVVGIFTSLDGLLALAHLIGAPPEHVAAPVAAH